MRPKAELRRIKTFFLPKLVEKSKSPQKFESILSLEIDASNFKPWTDEDVTGIFWTYPWWKSKASKGFKDLSCNRGISCEQKNLTVTSCILCNCFQEVFKNSIPCFHASLFFKRGKLTKEPDVVLFCRIFVSLIISSTEFIQRREDE